MLKISNNPSLKGQAFHHPNIIYSTAGGKQISMDLLLPWTPVEDARFPLVVFIQGCGFHFPDIRGEILQLADLARAGYAVAAVTHRNISDGFPAPAFLKDVKTAIRFLRAHADSYHIDPDRVYAFGTSSGGCTALLLGLTGDMEEYRTEEYAEYSDHVDAVIDCFGATDLTNWLDDPTLMAEHVPAFCGGEADPEFLRRLSPISYVQPGRSYVPFLLAHGDADVVVPFSESKNMADRLEECGADVSLICVEGGDHEGNFWSEQIWELFRHFLDKQSGLGD